MTKYMYEMCESIGFDLVPLDGVVEPEEIRSRYDWLTLQLTKNQKNNIALFLALHWNIFV